jgi:hypothetical protein
MNADGKTVTEYSGCWFQDESTMKNTTTMDFLAPVPTPLVLILHLAISVRLS